MKKSPSCASLVDYHALNRNPEAMSTQVLGKRKGAISNGVLSRLPTYGDAAVRTNGAMVYEELIICGLATGWQWVL
ncbi:hypothetical protein CFR75_11195 [Komagataeibacter xylinus]|uniref:Uncharacterized protein n=1 Tax=Komagataeibacter xylinus TaxID=28448 RepID=A0A318PMV3_KOMXY|nr:hypothetical protein CFR75_11195 [Komagataeibacter xylinus]GBQ70401.1 hypothetical protein AA15237_0862 [Komagataeibacter xylinus NBRC 15237]